MRKLLWFKDVINTEPTKLNFTLEEVHRFIELYSHRFDEELEQIHVKNSIGKRQNNGQHFSREKSIQMTLEQEKNEYETSGLGINLKAVFIFMI